MSETTCGVYIFNTKGELLVCHPNEIKADRWGIPKGRPEPGDLLKEAAVREVLEETGIDLKPYLDRMMYVGSEPYLHKDKTLVAWTVQLPIDIPIERLKCVSKFTSRYSGKKIPEIDAYKWVDFWDFRHKIQSEQVRLWCRGN